MKTEHKKFAPYDRVLVRDVEDKWQIDFYSHWNEEYKLHITLAYGDGLRIEDKDILPYEGNQHLLGTTDEPEEVKIEEVTLEKGAFIVASHSLEGIKRGKGTLENFIEPSVNYFLTQYGRYEYAIRFSDVNHDNLEETKKHIMCVQNGKVVRYKW